MVDALRLTCPIRGPLNTPAKSTDGLTPSEEARRIDAINFLLARGYPDTHIKVEATIKRFGHGGKSSFRADLAALDVPLSSIAPGSVEELLEHAVLLGEVKREHKQAARARETQVQPMLDFAHNPDCVALYWDDVAQRIYWRETKGRRRIAHESPASTLPRYGQRIAARPLTAADIKPSESLLDMLIRIEAVLHAAAIDAEARYVLILQLLLAKLYDEHSHEARPTAPLAIQDFKALGTRPSVAYADVKKTVGRAIDYYGKYLPREVPGTLEVAPETLVEIAALLAPVKIIASRQDVVQTFYMYFAKHLYKWDLAQFFTPVTVTDFIARVLNPQFDDHVRDPACGSADFLTSAYRLGAQTNPSYHDCVWGSDNSANAVQVAVLNMLLNGDGKSNITLEDSLLNVDRYADRYDIIICNPPFGARISESRRPVLANFDLGHEWGPDEQGQLQPTSQVRERQQVGILFAELCVRQAKPGGRIGIILPNGYLGNRGTIYHALREWLLRQCRVASICSFPRFTFKTSGADVSASVVFLEKRRRPLKASAADTGYQLHVGLIESVGWQLGDKGAKPIYVREPADGSYLTDGEGNRILDADFDGLLAEIRDSDAARRFRWIAGGPSRGARRGWSVSAARVVEDPTRCLDPKRLSRKATRLRDEIAAKPHRRLGDLVEVLPELTGRWKTSVTYRYVELGDITDGGYVWTTLRGWELPDRARHGAVKGDLFVGNVWGSVQKWMLAGGDTSDLIVTNGCHRLRVRKGMKRYLIDVVAALATEAYATQMRAFARGSDGLAEVSADEAMEVLIPELTDRGARARLRPFVTQLERGYTTMRSIMDDLIEQGLDVPVPARRPSHSVLV
ncbi:MAG TPA: N-6 DNA methylase [Solirubrobacteraceae bacterium]|nr:N-6 DNA methylase [Solirubrobacteraceae bacterium]